MKILFLDFDGVVNTPMWNSEARQFEMNFPHHNKVNNKQAVDLISRFCKMFDFQIVVTSDWRLNSNWRECLLNGGLDPTITILDRTDNLWQPGLSQSRGLEIHQWLDNHCCECFIIVDDDISDIDEDLLRFTVQTDSDTGFTEWNFQQCIDILEKQERKEIKWQSM